MERSGTVAWETRVRGGPVPFLARLLLLAVIPCSVVWFPVALTPAGTIAGSDAILIALWALTAVDVVVAGTRRVDLYAPAIVLLAIGIAVLAAMGAEIARARAEGAFEFMLFMKRFGLAAIIPLCAARFGSPAMGAWTRLVTLALVALLVVFTLRPDLAELLPRPEEWERGAAERATGLGTNPNDLAYAAIALAILHCAFLPRHSAPLARIALLAVLAGAALCVIASGSRSGLAGAVAAIGYLVVSRTIRARSKAFAIGWGVAAVLIGLSSSAVFRERMERVYQRGAQEENVAGRVYSQWSAVRASARYPLGVGFRNISWATRRTGAMYEIRTTDSVYLDTLVGAGYLGLVALLALLRSAWRHLAVSARDPRAAATLQSGLVAFFVFGAATVVPVSVFLSPLFFTIVAGGSHAGTRSE